ncbi:MAG: type II toxin-antitoxin system YhaV family toxin [Betaproteobacteria bacterium]|nr:type II toxin-antitoxin system YhaV family toxin [Betaproteobacteria bacterium]
MNEGAKPRESNGWQIWFGELFDVRWRTLRDRVKHLRAALDKRHFASHPEVKLFAALVHIVHETVPRDPEHSDFRLGKTLGARFTGWRRVKQHGLPDRMRLFFKFSSAHKVIVFAWLNDADTLRKDGASSDPYAVFRRMLEAGNPPDDFNELLKAVGTGK